MKIKNMSEILMEIDKNAATEVREHLDQRGLRLLRQEETDKLAAEFSQGLVNGLDHKPGGLPMINTGLRSAEFNLLKSGEEALVLVLGGTHNRVAVVTIDDEKRPTIREGNYFETGIDHREFSRPEDFYDAMLGPLAPFITEKKPQAAAVIFAFNSQVTTDRGLDMIPMVPLGKEFAVAGIDQTRVGEVLFKRPIMSRLQSLERKIVVNDMGPVLIAGEAKIGSIVATGFNIGLCIDGFYYVTECGGHFEGMPMHDYAKQIDRDSNNRGHGLLEKQLAPGYYAKTLGISLSDLGASSLISLNIGRDLRPEDVTELLNENSKLLRSGDENTQAVLKNIAARIGYRAAQAVGTLIGSGIKTFPKEFSEDTAKVSILSPVFDAMIGFSQIVNKYAVHYAGKPVQFVNVPYADILGAAVAALNQN